jgi:hypothetical protein
MGRSAGIFGVFPQVGGQAGKAQDEYLFKS